LTVSGLSAANKVYDATTSAALSGTAAVTALAGDIVTVGGTPVGSFTDKNVGTAKSVTVVGNTLSGTDAGNYNLQQASLSANITAKALTVSGLTASDKVYDATTSAALSGTAAVTALAGDIVTVGGTPVGSFADMNVGTSKSVTVVGNTLSGTDASNYTLTQQAGLNADIVAVPAAVIAPQKPAPARTNPVIVPPTATSVSSNLMLPTLTASPSASASISISAPPTSRGVASNDISAPTPASIQATSSSPDVSVSIVILPTQQTKGLVRVLVPSGTAASGSALVIALPETVTLSPQSTDQSVSLNSPNDQPPPTWIRYDAQNKTLAADAVPASAFPLSIELAVGGQSTLIQVSEPDVNP
jgi:hypothetical protein